MTFFEYQQAVQKTESVISDFVGKNGQVVSSRVLHGVIGISTESGELLDAIKKQLFYGKNLDLHNVKEELGDLMWYIATVCNALEFDFSDILQININKLSARYNGQFNASSALNRDINKERSIIENK